MSRYQFKTFVFDEQNHALSKGGQQIHMGSIAYKILLYFIHNPHKIIHKNELMAHVWENVVVTDATLYKQIQRLRQLLDDNAENKHIIETIHGEGFKFLPELIKLDTAIDTTEINKVRTNAPVFILLATLLLMVTYFIVYSPSVFKLKSQGISLKEAIFNMNSAMEINKKAFMSQIGLRNELGAKLDQRLGADKKLTWERKFFHNYDQMNEEEHFVFSQIRAYTEGPMAENNQLLLDLITHNPKILTEIPLANELRNHLVIWLNKYNKIFKEQKKMCLLYVGVEDGAPYPSKVDQQVVNWLKNH